MAAERIESRDAWLTDGIEYVKQRIAAGSLILAGLALVKIRQRYDIREHGAVEQAWPAFVAKHFPGEDIAKLIGRVAHHGGTHRCTACGTEVLSRCDCGAAYLPTGPAPCSENATQIPGRSGKSRGRPKNPDGAMTSTERSRRSRAARKAAQPC